MKYSLRGGTSTGTKDDFQRGSDFGQEDKCDSASPEGRKIACFQKSLLKKEV